MNYISLVSLTLEYMYLTLLGTLINTIFKTLRILLFSNQTSKALLLEMVARTGNTTQQAHLLRWVTGTPSTVMT